MLVGRQDEQRAVAALLAGARVGRSGVLVLSGEAGIGKTALLEDAVAASGMRVLRARGVESESEVPFGGLLQLLRPVLAHLDRIPAPQAAALAGALALVAATGDDRYAVGAGTLSLLSRSAEDRPVLVLLDDAHLLDVPSVQALAFAARRLTADPLAVLATVREGEPCALLDAGLPVLRVGGLSLEGTRALLAASGSALGAHEVARLHALTGGNPLAVAELAGEGDSLDPPVFGTPVPVPASLVRAFARRVDLLAAPVRTALLVAAAVDLGLDVVAAACALLGVDVDAALSAGEDAGLLRVVDGGVVFRHALVRAAVYAGAEPGARRSAHRALSQVVTDPDRRAWHRAQAALGPDEEVARDLVRLAAGAGRRSAHAVAAVALERAARLSPAVHDRAERLSAAGEAAWQAGQGAQAVIVLAEASSLAPEPAVRTRAAAVRGSIAARTGSAEQARDLLVSAAAEAAATDPDGAVLLLADAVLTCIFLADVPTVRTSAALVADLGARVRDERARLVGALLTGVADVLTGGGAGRIRAALRGIDPAGAVVDDLRVAPWLVVAPLFLRETGTGRDLAARVVEGLRRRTVVGGLPFLLFYVARDDATTARWDTAGATYAEGVALAREAGQSSDLAANLAGLAWLEARQGREQACREHAAEALALSGRGHLGLFASWVPIALGELELALGRPGAALEAFAQAERTLAGLGLVDVDVSPAPETVEALLGEGRGAQAREVAAGYAARAAAKGEPWALARAGRTTLLTCPDDDLDDAAARTFAAHARTTDAFELARSRLAYGARLRRARRRVDARPPLRAALASLEQLGAVPWAVRAAAELAATGETVPRRGARPAESLTPQELQVARLLADGRTTREAAASLFLSPKTVEYHLRHVYGKLAIGSRAELRDRLAGDG